MSEGSTPLADADRNAGQRPEARIAADLVTRISGGEQAAETELVERYSRGVLYLLRRITRDPALAEDLHQETFVVVLERLRRSGLEQPEKLAGFVRATARNLFTGVVRKRLRRDTHSDSDRVERAMDRPADESDVGVGAAGQLGHVLSRERARAVRQALAELRTDRDRQILYRFYLLEENKETLCADLGLSDLHFNRVLFRARQRFRQVLEAGGGGGLGRDSGTGPVAASGAGAPPR